MTDKLVASYRCFRIFFDVFLCPKSIYSNHHDCLTVEKHFPHFFSCFCNMDFQLFLGVGYWLLVVLRIEILPVFLVYLVVISMVRYRGIGGVLAVIDWC